MTYVNLIQKFKSGTVTHEIIKSKKIIYPGKYFYLVDFVSFGGLDGNGKLMRMKAIISSSEELKMGTQVVILAPKEKENYVSYWCPVEPYFDGIIKRIPEDEVETYVKLVNL